MVVYFPRKFTRSFLRRYLAFTLNRIHFQKLWIVTSLPISLCLPWSLARYPSFWASLPSNSWLSAPVSQYLSNQTAIYLPGWKIQTSHISQSSLRDHVISAYGVTSVISFSCFLAEGPASWSDSSSSLTDRCYGPVNFCFQFFFFTIGVISVDRVWVPVLTMVSSDVEALLPLLWWSWTKAQ